MDESESLRKLVMKTAYCHPDEVGIAEAVVRNSVDSDAVVFSHPWMRPGEVIICSTPDLPPLDVTMRHYMEEMERSNLSALEMVRILERIKIDYRMAI